MKPIKTQKVVKPHLKTTNEQMGIILMLMILLLFPMAIFEQLVYLFVPLFFSLFFVMIAISIRVKIMDGKILPHDSVVHLKFYEIHIDRDVILSESKSKQMLWVKELFEKLSKAKPKTIVFEVSTEIFSEKNAIRYFGKDAVKSSDVSFFSKCTIFILKCINRVSLPLDKLFLFKKKKRYKKPILKNVRRYVIDYDRVNWDLALKEISSLYSKVAVKYP